MVGRTVSHHCVVKLFESGAWNRLSGRRHGRQIALEFLLADFTRDRRAPERYQREARAKRTCFSRLAPEALNAARSTKLQP